MKPKEILEIENYYDLKLTPLIEDDRLESKVEFYKNENTFALNSKNEIIKINLKDNSLADLNVLSNIRKTVTHLNLAATRIQNIEVLSNFKNLISLDLSTNAIEDINPIKGLKDLEYLYLDNNKISIIPKLKLPKLFGLWLYSNEIEDITNLQNLYNLVSLNVSYNKIKDIDLLKSLKNLKDINLRKNQISDILSISNFKNLYSLNLSSNKINDLKPLSNIFHIKELNLENNQIENVNPLKSIQIDELFIGENNIIDLSPLYSSFKLKNIQFINVNNSPNLLYPTEEIAKRGEERIVEWFDMIFENIEKCNQKINEVRNDENIKSLDLGMMGLTDLSMLPNLFQLENLEVLILSNHYAEYIEKGKYWEKVKSKNKFYPNNLSNIPNDIKKLKKLKKLIIGGDWKDGDRWNRWRIEDTTPVFSLKKLEYLNVSNNKIEKIKVTNRTKLSNLKVIHLNNNVISTFYTLTKYPNLEELYLSNNELTRVTNLANITTLKTIDLHGNKIESIKPLLNLLKETNINISDTKWEKNTINIKDNPLEEPNYETIYSGKDAVIRYFFSLTDWKTIVNKEIKLILVGNSEAGKSTLVKYLDAENDLGKKHDATHWMVEKEVTSKHIIDKINEKCNLRLFDFGGQDYYHDTHHIFFSNNTIYLLLWENLTNNLEVRKLTQTVNRETKEIETQDYPIKYWLESVKHFIKEESNIKGEGIDKYQYNSNLLLIQNKVTKANEIKPQNNKNIKDGYPFVYDFITINILEPRRNLGHFDNLLTEIINEMDVVGSNILEYQHLIRQEIKNYNGEPILSLAKFKNYCNENLPKEITDGELEDLCSYLKQLGLIFYFKEDNKKNVFIDKNWVLENMYKILDGLDKQKGEFDREYIGKAINLNLDNRLIDNLIDLMTRFKIIFYHPINNKFIAPLYLPKKPLDGVNLFLMEKRIPYRRFEYKGFIHKTIILDFFQKYGENTLEDEKRFYYWKDGLIIKDIVTSQILHIEFNIGNEYGNAYIDIFKLNSTDKKNIFVSDVIETIKKINREFRIDDEDFEEMVTINNEDFVSLDLIKLNAKQRKFIFSERKMSETNIKNKVLKKNINLIDYEEFFDKENAMKKIFISYSKDDLDIVMSFVNSLQSLVIDGIIAQPWYCTYLQPGDEVHNKIREKMVEADIVCYMCSNNFYKTKYIIEHELKPTIKKYETDKKQIILPIIIDRCRWILDKPEINLGNFSGFPYRGKPVVSFYNWNDAWYVTNYFLEQVIKKKLINNVELFDSINDLPNDIQELLKLQANGDLNK